VSTLEKLKSYVRGRLEADLELGDVLREALPAADAEYFRAIVDLGRTDDAHTPGGELQPRGETQR